MSALTAAIDARLLAGDYTGDSTYWNGLLAGFQSLQAPIKLLLISDRAKPDGLALPKNAEWIASAARNSRWWSWVTFPLLARRLKADVIHTQYNLSPLTGNRGITTIHDVSFFIGSEWFTSRDRMLLQRFVPASVRRAKIVFTVSETSRKEIARYIPESSAKTIVTPLALNPSITPYSKENALQILGEQTTLRGQYLLTVGTLWPRKNTQLAIDAFELMHLPDTTLAVTGKQGFGSVETKGSIQRLGYVSEQVLSALYSAAELYLLPSFHEGFGLTLLEAFACRCPVLASSGGAIPEVAGDAARIERTWDASSWAATAKDLLGDWGSLEEMRERGIRRVQQFNWSHTAALTLAGYEKALS